MRRRRNRSEIQGQHYEEQKVSIQYIYQITIWLTLEYNLFLRKFEEELLRDTRDIKPEEIFEIPTAQENEGEGDVDLMIKMEQLVLELPAPGDDDENRLMMLAREHMTPLAGVEGVYKRICKSGHGRMPPPDSIVTVHYNAYLEDELSSEVKPFDSTVLRGQPFSFM